MTLKQLIAELTALKRKMGADTEVVIDSSEFQKYHKIYDIEGVIPPEKDEKPFVKVSA
jgi:hypothetical protein